MLSTRYLHTVKKFIPCTGRPGVSQCLVVQSPMDNMSEKVKNINDPRRLQIKACLVVRSVTCVCINTQETGCQSRVQSCIMPVYLVQDLNSGIV